MPLDEEGRVSFTTTLFALIRENLSIKMRPGKMRVLSLAPGYFNIRSITAEEMDQADSELRQTIKQIWPIQAKKMIDLLVPPKEMLNTGKMTVGKIYAGILLLETWRNNKCVQLECDAPDLQDRKSHEIQEAYIDDGHLHPGGHDARGAHRRSPSIQYGYHPWHYLGRHWGFHRR